MWSDRTNWTRTPSFSKPRPCLTKSSTISRSPSRAACRAWRCSLARSERKLVSLTRYSFVHECDICSGLKTLSGPLALSAKSIQYSNCFNLEYFITRLNSSLHHALFFLLSYHATQRRNCPSWIRLPSASSCAGLLRQSLPDAAYSPPPRWILRRCSISPSIKTCKSDYREFETGWALNGGDSFDYISR